MRLDNAFERMVLAPYAQRGRRALWRPPLMIEFSYLWFCCASRTSSGVSAGIVRSFPKIAEHTSVPDMTRQTASAIPRAQGAKRRPKLIGCRSINVKNVVARPIKTQGTLEQIETNGTALSENLNL